MYKIYCDDLCIYDPSNENIESAVVNPKLSISDNTAGSLKFTMPITNVGYGKYSMFRSDIKVYNDDKIMWRGRIITDAEDFNRSRAIECEGALAFLNDTIQPARHATISDILDVHNARVTADRQIKMGVIDIPSASTYLMEYQTTYEAISKIVENLGWHMRIRCVGDEMYLDILKDYLHGNTQTIEFGVNLLDFTSTFDVTDLTTVIIPRGKSTKTEDSDIETYVTIESVNNGSMYLESSELVTLYGVVEKTVDWPNISTPQNLLSLAQAYLSDYQFDGLVLDVSVLDLHILNPEITSIGLLDVIHCVSAPHGMDRYFPVTKMEIDLSNPAGTTITLNKAKSAPMSEQASDIGDDMDDKITRVEEKIDNIEVPDPKTILDQAKADARDLISSATGGYVTMVMDENNDHVEELVISNTEDWTQADQYWRWNINGLGYFDASDPEGLKVAMTMDGQIVADLITVGTMSADRIKGGTLELGNYDGQPGRIFMYDGTGEEIGSWSESGITATKGVFKGDIESGDFNKQGIRISNGIIYGYANGTSQGYIDTGKDIKGDHDNYLGAGFRMANRVGVLIKTPLLGTNTEYVDPPEGGLYMQGMTGAITLTADMGVSVDGLTYQTKTLQFVNGLMVTSLANTSGGGSGDSGGGDSGGGGTGDDGGSTGGGSGGSTEPTDTNPFVIHRGDYITPVPNDDGGILDMPIIPVKGADCRASFVLPESGVAVKYGFAELLSNENSKSTSGFNQITVDSKGLLYNDRVYPEYTATATRYKGPVIIPLCTAVLCDSSTPQNNIPYFVGVYQKENAVEDASWIITSPIPSFGSFESPNYKKVFQIAEVDDSVFGSGGPKTFFDDSLPWKDESATPVIAYRYGYGKDFPGMDVFEQRVQGYDPTDSITPGDTRNVNIFGLDYPYRYSITPAHAGWVLAFDIMDGDPAFHIMRVGCTKSRLNGVPEGATATNPNWYTDVYDMEMTYGFYAKYTAGKTRLIRPYRIHPDSVYLIPLHRQGQPFDRKTGKIMSHSNIYILPSKADAEELINRFTNRDYETQESIETDFQDRFLYWHNPNNRERCAIYISTNNNGLYPIY